MKALTHLAEVSNVLHDVSATAKALVASLSAEQMVRRPEPNAWSVAECLAHRRDRVEHAARTRRPLHPAPGRATAAVAAVTAEQFVGALAAQRHLQPRRARRPAEHPGRQHGGVGRRIVDRGGDARPELRRKP